MSYKLDWESPSTEVFLSPRLPQPLLSRFRQINLPHLKSHVWLASSGTTHQLKLIALSKEAILTSARVVNERVQASCKDHWFNVLPSFHIGGLSIYGRAFLLGAKVTEAWSPLWDPMIFTRHSQRNKITLTSLVPTQIYDLVKAGLRAPEKLRAVFVGGGSLNEALYQKGLELGWPLLPTYGLTECSSQVATAQINDLGRESLPRLRVLPHIKVDLSSEGLLRIKSPSLFSQMVVIDIHKEGLSSMEVHDRREDWYQTSDLVELGQGDELIIHGRQDEVVKVGGELVNLTKLNGILSQIIVEKKLGGEWLVVANPDERLGCCVDLVTTELESLEEVALSFRKLVQGFEAFHKAYVVREIPRNDMAKVKSRLLQKMLIGG